MNLIDSNSINFSKIKKKSVTPIQSYGIILFINNATVTETKFLICQRRDTIEYADFVRGKVTRKNLSIYLNLMTEIEQEKILKYNFDQLWDDLWVCHTCKLYKESYEYSKYKYSQYIDDAKKILVTFNKNDSIKQPPWGFPKGKKHLNENELECALREFKEETGIYLDYKYVLNIPAVVETFKGSNGIFYQTIYYIAEMNEIPKINKIINGERGEIISEEIMDVKFVNINEAKNYLSEWRISLLEKLLAKINVN
jgi:8-oxo-dGTP pyrophosphatase MutT (NUDIX family)